MTNREQLQHLTADLDRELDFKLTNPTESRP
jgi:hypothetical protein